MVGTKRLAVNSEDLFKRVGAHTTTRKIQLCHVIPRNFSLPSRVTTRLLDHGEQRLSFFDDISGEFHPRPVAYVFR